MHWKSRKLVARDYLSVLQKILAISNRLYSISCRGDEVPFQTGEKFPTISGVFTSFIIQIGWGNRARSQGSAGRSSYDGGDHSASDFAHAEHR